jgi:hypothetical protein
VFKWLFSFEFFGVLKIKRKNFLLVRFGNVGLVRLRVRFSGACGSGGFSASKFLKIPELSTSTKVSKNAQNPPFLQTVVVRSLFIF